MPRVHEKNSCYLRLEKQRRKEFRLIKNKRNLVMAVSVLQKSFTTRQETLHSLIVVDTVLIWL